MTSRGAAQSETSVAKVVFRNGPLRGNVLALEKDRVSMGRDPRNDIAIADNIISGFHAAIVREESDSYWLEDLGSKNGTFLNGQQIQRELLKDGDVFFLCQSGPEIQFTLGRPQLPGIIESSTATFARTRSVARALRELLPNGRSGLTSLLQLTGVRKILDYGFEEATRRSRRSFLIVFVAFACLSSLLLAGTFYLQTRGSGREPTIASPSAPTEASWVALEADLEPIYGSLFLSYRQNPIGTATVIHSGTEPLSGCEVRLSIESPTEQFLVEPFSAVVPELLPGARESVPLKPKLLESVRSDRTREVTAVIELWKSGTVLSTLRRGLFIHDWHVFSWEQPERIAAFVDPLDPAVTAFVRAVGARQPAVDEREFPPPRVVRALTLLTGLAELGLRYQPEGRNPTSAVIDENASDLVNYPWETLLLGSGDCDDLSVLSCAVLEKVDIPTALVVGDRHVFFMFDSGMAASSLARLPVDAESFVVLGERVWMPIEATEYGKPGANFTSAWSKAFGCSRRIAAGELRVVEIRESHRKYPPMNPPLDDRGRQAVASTVWTKDGLQTSIDFSLGSLRKFFRDQLDQKLEEIDRTEDAGAARDQAKGRLLAEAGFIGEARKWLEHAVFGDAGPPALGELARWASGLSEDVAVLLTDLALCIAVGQGSRSDLDLAAKYMETALPAFAGLPAVDRGQIMLRLAVVHGMRGDVAAREEWRLRAFDLDASLRGAWEILMASDGRVGTSAAAPQWLEFLRAGLR